MHHLPKSPARWSRPPIVARWSVAGVIAVACLFALPGGTVATPSGRGSTTPPAAAVPAMRLPGVALSGPTPLSPVPTALARDLARPLDLGSTATNWLVANWSGEGMIAENPANPLNLVSGGLYQAASAYNSSTVYYNKGVSGVFTSWDGGRTWTDQVVPANESWFNTSSTQCNHVHLADTAVAFGPNNTAYYLDLTDALGDQSCTGPVASLSLYVTISHDGGNTWGQPIGVAGMDSSGSIDKPWMAVDERTGEVYVAYTDDGNGSQIYLQNSTDDGQRWSTPLKLPQGTNSNRGVELVVDPYGGVDALWIDQTTAGIYFARSSDHGASFSTDVLVATATTEFPSASPDTFRDYTLPGLGVDEYGGGGDLGRLFATWQNGSGGSSPMATSMSYSSDNGSTWIAPVTVDAGSAIHDYQPDVAVGPDGTVYEEWYGENSTTGLYRLYGSESHDGGTTFTPRVPVSDVNSYPEYPGAGGLAGWWIGDYTHIVADANGARPLWTDARSKLAWSCSPCLWGVDYNISFYTAEMTNGSIASNVPVNLTMNGTVVPNGTLAAGPTATDATWLVGETYNVTAPATVLVAGVPWYFSEWYGSTLSSARSVAGTVRGMTDLRVCYTAIAGALCDAPGAPGLLTLNVVPANASVRLNAHTLTLSAGSYQALLAPGTYTVNATAPDYHPLGILANVSTGTATFLNLTLAPILGWLNGTLSPASALLQVGGLTVPVNASGTFSVALVQGVYRVTASQYGYGPYSNPSVQVRSGQTSSLVIVLTALLGELAGTVFPSNATVYVDSIPVNSPGGLFNLSETEGTYWVNATGPELVPVSSGPVTVRPLQVTTVTLRLLPAPGTLAGTVTVADAVVTVNGTVVPSPGGSFSLNTAPGPVYVNASAPGYRPVSELEVVQSNGTTFVNLALPIAPGWIDGTVAPAAATVLIDGASQTVAADGTFNFTGPPGDYRVDVSASGYAANTSTVFVRAGHATDLVVFLPSGGAGAGAVGGWVLWAGLGAGLVAAAGLVVLVLRRRRSAPPS